MTAGFDFGAGAISSSESGICAFSLDFGVALGVVLGLGLEVEGAGGASSSEERIRIAGGILEDFEVEVAKCLEVTESDSLYK